MRVAFLSYDRHNNLCLGGRVVEFCKKIDAYLQLKLGLRENAIFIDEDSIKLSVEWRPEIEDVINNISVFLPVISPGWLERPECLREYELFVKHERSLTNTPNFPGNTRLIIPLVLEKPLSEQESYPIWQDLHKINHPQVIMPFVEHRVGLESAVAAMMARKLADRIRDLHLLVKNQIGKIVIQSHRDSEKIKASLHNYSAALADWPKTIGNNRWLERAELKEILKLIESCDSSTRFIVGKPGTGKSAILSSFYELVIDSGIVCLGIKADALPVAIDSLEKFSEHVLGKKLDLATLLCELALRQKVVVIIDQLDALADLVDLNSGRLNVLLDLIARIRDCHGIHLVASVRDFELTFDKRLESLIATADGREFERIDLKGFTREQVFDALQDELHVDATKWPDEHLLFLETPYYLAQFTQHFAALTADTQTLSHEQFFGGIQQAHRCTYEVTVARSNNREALNLILYRLAQRIEQTEELWHDPEQLGLCKKDESHVDELEALRWMHRQTDGRLGFAHQTQYEFVLGKRFVNAPVDFINYVQQRQDGLFVRPTVWHSLALMRVESKTSYEIAMGQLLARIERRHLRRLFIEFLAEVADPSTSEITWVVGLLESPEQSARMCWLLRGKRCWFERLPDATFNNLMNQAPDKTWPVCRLIEASWPFEIPRTSELIRGTWAFQKDYVGQTWFALSQATMFDDETFTWLTYCASEHSLEDDDWSLNRCLKTLCAIRPEWAYRVFSLILHRRIDKHPVSRFEWRWLSENELTAAAKELAEIEAELGRMIEEELGRNRWYGIEDLAQQDPIAFIQAIWPWFLQAMRFSGERYRSRLLTFRVEDDSHRWFGDDPWPGSHLVIAIVDSLGTWAKTDRLGFLRFVSENSGVDSMTVQRMFAGAMIPIAHLEPSYVLAFFRDDTRRFFLDVHQRSRDTNSLLNAMIPHLQRAQINELQRFVLAWQMYRNEGEPEYVDGYRADLLYNFPGHLRTQEVNELVKKYRLKIEKETAQYANYESFRFHQLTSPLPLNMMSEMCDVELLDSVRRQLTSFHNQNSRDSAWERHDLARQFSELVKSDPDRGASLTKLFTQPLEGGLVGAAIHGLVKVGFPSDQILDLIRHLSANDYEGREFHDEVGSALRDLAITEKGLPDDILQILAQWFLNDPVEDETDEPTEPVEVKQNSVDEPVSVLWPGGGLWESFPNTWFYIGEAIKLGYCCRPEPNVTVWFDVYSAAMDRPFPREVWRALIFELIRFWPDRQLAANLLSQLIVKRPDVMESDVGVRAVAMFGTWIETDTRNDYLRSVVESQSPRVQQGAGELAVMLRARDKDELARELIAAELATSDRENPSPFRLGIAFAAGNIWRRKDMRQPSMDILRSLLPSESHDINDAVLGAFNGRHELTDDESTRDLLSLIAEALTFRKTRDVFPLVDCLKSFVRMNPELTYRVMRRIVDGLQQIKQQDALYRIGHFEKDFINIVLTIHRQHLSKELRKDSLTLYEDLLDLEIYGAFESLKVLDQRPM